MFRLFFEGGIFMWPILIIAISIVILSIKKAIDLFGRTDLNQKQLESGLNAIVFWGAISAVFGFLAHFAGMYMAMVSIAEANDISPSIVARGFSVSLIPILFGLVIFMLSGILWLIFRWRRNKLISTDE
jgi:biopolymer transport protein ExbB/TolQ